MEAKEIISSESSLTLPSYRGRTTDRGIWLLRQQRITCILSMGVCDPEERESNIVCPKCTNFKVLYTYRHLDHL